MKFNEKGNVGMNTNTCRVHLKQMIPRLDTVTVGYETSTGVVHVHITNVPVRACTHPSCDEANVLDFTKNKIIDVIQEFEDAGLALDIIPYPLDFGSNQ